MKHKVLSVLFATVFTAGMLAGCGSSDTASQKQEMTLEEESTEGQTAVEFIKRVYTNLLLGVEVDEEKEYIYVTTMYPITDKKIENRVYSGKLINIKENK